MPHALVVEDDPNTLYALAELVEQEGFTTSTASTLADARMNVNSRTPDLVLLDMMLPDGNGIYLLKDLEALSSAEVVLITGHGSLDSAVEAFRLGAHDYMTKPVDIPRPQGVAGRRPGAGRVLQRPDADDRPAGNLAAGGRQS